jgi:hypothetical protein
MEKNNNFIKKNHNIEISIILKTFHSIGFKKNKLKRNRMVSLFF